MKLLGFNFRTWRIALINVGLLGVVLTYQACSKNYTVSLDSVGLPPECNSGACLKGESTPGIDQTRPPTKVLFVVDNSSSMSLSQESLAAGVNSLADELKGFDANFYIYTTSDKPGTTFTFSNPNTPIDKPVLAASPIESCDWSETNNSGVATTKNGAICPTNLATTTINQLLYTPSPSLGQDGSGNPLNFRASDSAEVLDSKSHDLAETIKNIGINGDDHETGLCSLVRSVYNEGPNSIFRSGDNAAMVILSDENDGSSLASCISRQTTEKSYVGDPAILQNCNPATESCDVGNYTINYKQQKLPYSKVTASYTCSEEKSDSGAPGSHSMSKVQYTFKPLRSSVTYTCENSKNYSITFNPLNKEIQYKTYTRVPYTITFNNRPTYSKTLNYQCQVLRDGVVRGESDVRTVASYLTNQTTCSDGIQADCNASQATAVQSLCTNGTVLKANSCKLTCNVGSQSVASLTYNDTASDAYSRNLTDLNSYPSTLSNWARAQSGYADAVINTMTRGTPDESSIQTKPLAYTAVCDGGASALEACDSAALTETARYISGANRLVPSSCNMRCNGSNATSSASYSDSITINDRDLTSNATAITVSGTNYANLKAYEEAVNYPKTVQSITLANTPRTYSSASSSFINENCAAIDSTGTDCSAASLAETTAIAGCGANRKLATCKQKCLTSSTSTTLTFASPSTEDSIDFCSNNTDTSKTFSIAGGAAYTSIKDYAEKNINPSQSVKATISTESGSCSRAAYSYQSANYSFTTNVNSLLSCSDAPAEYNFGQHFTSDTNFNCNKTSPRQSGYVTAPTFTCSNSDINGPYLRDNPDKPALTIHDDHHKVTLGDNNQALNLCNNAFVTDSGLHFQNVLSWAETQPGASGRNSELNVADSSLRPTCSVVFQKYVSPGTVSLSHPPVTKTWSFPLNVESTDTSHDLKSAFVNRSNELFGPNGYFVSAFVRDPALDTANSCNALAADQSSGSKYVDLIHQIASSGKGPKGQVASICASSYSNALSSVSDWIKKTTQRTVYASEIVRSDMKILRVYLYDPTSKKETMLKSNKDFEIVGRKINITNPNINLEGRTLRYLYWDPQGTPGSGSPKSQ